MLLVKTFDLATQTCVEILCPDIGYPDLYRSQTRGSKASPVVAHFFTRRFYNSFQHSNMLPKCCLVVNHRDYVVGSEYWCGEVRHVG